MSGPVDYLLDTNYVLALVKQNPVIAADKAILSDPAMRFGISTISRMELLGFPGITESEEREILAVLARLHEIWVHQQVVEQTIGIRRKRRIKLPDAIIIASALVSNARLLTLDTDMASAFQAIRLLATAP